VIKRIFSSIVLVGIFVFAASVILIMGVMYTHFSAVQREELRDQAELIAQGAETERSFIKAIDAKNSRITWVDKDGEVKYDSKADPSEMENHKKREEIREAFEKGEGESSRYSSTMLEREIYVAERLDDGTVVRLAATELTIPGLLLGVLNPMMIVAILTLLLSLFLAFRLSKRIIKPLNDMELDEKGDVPYEELKPLVDKLTSQKEMIRDQRVSLLQKENEFSAAIGNMTEGFILLDVKGCIVTANRAAKEIFGIPSYPEGNDIMRYNDDPELKAVIKRAEKGEHCEVMIPIGDIDYEFHISPVLSGSEVTAVAMMILDITEKEKAEMIRREFTANVTHELKTPLQTISGSAELMAKGVVKQEDISEFSEKIYAESKRMIALIDDVIGLSQLEEAGAQIKKEELDLYAVAELTVRDLLPAAEKRGIKISLEGGSVIIQGVPQMMESIIYNLIDNSIKYGREGGHVDVHIDRFDKSAVIEVADDGIGIPESEKERIFERFYRVDKSRSKEAGGTGLGLSIVKHAAMIHDADIEVESDEGKGTTINVTIPLESNGGER
jgi:two-component system phosphate regulon sensor histidine kinase PhoR